MQRHQKTRSDTLSVLFVCSGNICRSPMAEAVFQHMVRQAGLEDKISADSAGTGSWHIGESAHYGTLDILKQHSIPYNGRARKIRSADLNDFDYVLAMDRSHLYDMQRYTDSARAEVQLFMHYANAAGLTDVREVPDPYYNGKFELVYDLVIKGCTALLDHIRARHNL
jgi:protein-tyrosine phosphatase